MRMNTFVNAVNGQASLNGTKTYTENGAVARSTTGHALMDFYAVCGAMRTRTPEEIIQKFKAALKENPLYATKCLFLTRDIRGGHGERRTFRIIARWMAENYPTTVIKNFPNIALMGRIDDFYSFVGTPIENDAFDYLRGMFKQDLINMRENKPVSLTAKWLKSVNTSSQESRKLARLTAKKFGLTEREYRKSLARLRNYISVVEVKMSANQWMDIDYSQVPSRAMHIYKDAFKRHNPAAFDTFIEKVERGEEKINATTLYPYDLVKNYVDRYYPSDKVNPVIEAQWKALPNYISGENNILVMADVSGSMYGGPIYSSVGLAIYFAERNKGPFKNLYMTFSSDPSYMKISPNQTLCDKIRAVWNNGVGYSTNLEKAMLKVLDTCVTNRVPQKDVPKALVVISDMEINPYFSGRGLDFVSTMAQRFASAGYEMPKIVLWNVEARNDVFHASYNNPYVQFATGQSPSTFKRVLEGLMVSPVEAMYKALDNPRYNSVVF